MNIVIAKTYKQKLMGLMGKKNINFGMFFPNVKSIHTFFMLKPIDVLGLDNNMIVREKYPNIKPNKILFLKNSSHTLELPNGASLNYKIGDKVNL